MATLSDAELTHATLPVIIRVKPEFFARNSRHRHGNRLELVRSYVADLTPRQVDLLMESEVVEYVTLDAKTRVSGGGGATASWATPELASIGADQILVKGKYPSGKNVVVALFDSGVGLHPDLAVGVSVIHAMDFTNGLAEPRWDGNVDEFGHGTHVAGIIAGDGRSGGIRGVAPDAQLIDLKVVGADGTGRTSDLIRAIEWTVRFREEWGIGVANLSLGHPAIDSYRDDPLCLAVEKLAAAGVVPVVSAGNMGKTETGQKIWGGISSPGIDPTVITVAAVNTRGTASHSDDVATTYASRGPSIDGLFKPDLAGPGNAIASLRVSGSSIDTRLRKMACRLDMSSDAATPLPETSPRKKCSGAPPTRGASTSQ